MTRREAIARYYQQEFYLARCNACTSATQDNCEECAGSGRRVVRREPRKFSLIGILRRICK